VRQVVTCFFLDTCDDLLDYITTLDEACSRPAPTRAAIGPLGDCGPPAAAVHTRLPLAFACAGL